MHRVLSVTKTTSIVVYDVNLVAEMVNASVKERVVTRTVERENEGAEGKAMAAREKVPKVCFEKFPPYGSF